MLCTQAEETALLSQQNKSSFKYSLRWKFNFKFSGESIKVVKYLVPSITITRSDIFRQLLLLPTLTAYKLLLHQFLSWKFYKIAVWKFGFQVLLSARPLKEMDESRHELQTITSHKSNRFECGALSVVPALIYGDVLPIKYHCFIFAIQTL